MLFDLRLLTGPLYFRKLRVDILIEVQLLLTGAMIDEETHVHQRFIPDLVRVGMNMAVNSDHLLTAIEIEHSFVTDRRESSEVGDFHVFLICAHFQAFDHDYFKRANTGGIRVHNDLVDHRLLGVCEPVILALRLVITQAKRADECHRPRGAVCDHCVERLDILLHAILLDQLLLIRERLSLHVKRQLQAIDALLVMANFD